MPNFCAAPNCTRKSTQSDLAFFRFPRDPNRCQKWVENCRRADLEDKTPDQLNKHYRLCAQHFEDSMICRSSPYRTVLRENAIPTIFDLTSHLGNPGRRRKRIKELSEDEIRLLKERKRTEMVFGLHHSFLMASKSFLDIELLIALVRLHPELYDPQNASFNDCNRGMKLWYEISSEIFPDWNDLNPQQRSMKVQEVQTKWHSLKENFKLELLKQISHNSSSRPRNPSFSHYKDLLFLEPVMLVQKTDCYIESSTGPEALHEKTDSTDEDVQIVYVEDGSSSPCLVAENRCQTPGTAHGAGDVYYIEDDNSQEAVGLMNGLAGQNQEATDPHVDFAHSLVPYLAQVPDRHQTSLRMALANIIFCYIENTQGHTPTASPQLLKYISPSTYPYPSSSSPKT